MIISDAVFDHRQTLMQNALMAHGLSEAQIARWIRVEVHYRNDIVKDRAWPKRMGNIELPLEGFAEEKLSVGSICDYCGDGIEAGTWVRYHVRLGKISCPSCKEPDALATSTETA
jgi:hypothetical protein